MLGFPPGVGPAAPGSPSALLPAPPPPRPGLPPPRLQPAPTMALPCTPHPGACHDAGAGPPAGLPDPTMWSCCERDAREAAQADRLRAQLLAHDRSNVRLQLREEVLQAAPPPAQQADSSEAEDDDGTSPRFSSPLNASPHRRIQQELPDIFPRNGCPVPGDAVLDTLRLARLRQLKAEAARLAQRREETRGVLHDVDEGCLLVRSAARNCRPRVLLNT